MAYMTYEEYQAYGGSLDATEYVLEEFKARKYLDYLTCNRIAFMSEIPEEVKLAEMELINFDAKFSASSLAEARNITSFSTDGYSESYGSVDSQAATVKAAALETVRNLLFGVTNDKGVPLLYRGIGYGIMRRDDNDI